MRNIYLAGLIVLFAACSEAPKDQQALTLPEGQLPTMAGTGATPPPAGVTVNPPHGQPGHDCALPVGAPLKSAAVAAPQTISPAQPVQVAGGGNALNPAHGQPGHRCDIAVGAPLNAASGNATQVVTTSAPAAAMTAKGMNPAHGQPGHRCDIAVGAPLNSKVKKTIASTPQPAPIKEAAIVAEANGG